MKYTADVANIECNGVENVNLDDNNPAIVKVMKKYEVKEIPQCQ